MERRKSFRVAAQSSATLHILGKNSAAHNALVTDASPRGLQIRIPVPVEIDEAVRVAMEDLEIFAEVCHCQRNPDGTFSAGLWIHEILSGLHNLRDVLDSFESALQPSSPRNS